MAGRLLAFEACKPSKDADKLLKQAKPINRLRNASITVCVLTNLVIKLFKTVCGGKLSLLNVLIKMRIRLHAHRFPANIVLLPKSTSVNVNDC